jgi:hypothetical protein
MIKTPCRPEQPALAGMAASRLHLRRARQRQLANHSSTSNYCHAL